MPAFALSSSLYAKENLGAKFFREAAENDFSAVEIVITPGHFRGSKEEVRLIKKVATEYHIHVESVHCDMEILDPPTIEIFKRAKEVLLHNLDVVSEFGADVLVIHGYIFADPNHVMVDENGGLHPGLSVFKGLKEKTGGMLERVKTGMAEYAHEAGKRGVSIALETDTHPGINRMLPELISEADPESCGICFDTGHAQIESDAVQTVKEIGSRVICTHLHDNDGKKDQHLPPFKGIIAWEKFLGGLTAAGYRGTYTFECGGALADIVEAQRRFGEMLNTLIFAA